MTRTIANARGVMLSGPHMTTVFRKGSLLALLFIALSVPTKAQDDPSVIRSTALVTVQISDLGQEIWSSLNARVSKEPGVNVEYSCMTTGIIVLHLRNVMAAERSDVMVVVKRILREAGVRGTIDFLDVHVEQGDGNKCQAPDRHQARCRS